MKYTIQQFEKSLNAQGVEIFEIKAQSGKVWRAVGYVGKKLFYWDSLGKCFSTAKKRKYEHDLNFDEQ